MLNKLKQGLSHLSEKINPKINKVRKNISSLVLATLMGTGAAGSNAMAADFMEHKVESGDTLYQIALNNGTTVKKIIELDGNIGENGHIRIGQVIKIKKLESSEKQTNTQIPEKIHKVKSGDNLYRIAINNNTTEEKLRELNPWIGKYIHPGQNIVLSIIEDKTPTTEETLDFVGNDFIEEEPNFSQINHQLPDEILMQITNALLLNKTIGYGKMHRTTSMGKDAFYTISPSDTPVFLGKIKYINGSQYIKVRLANDKNENGEYIVGYVNIDKFDSQTQDLIEKVSELYSKENNIVELHDFGDELEGIVDSREENNKDETVTKVAEIQPEIKPKTKVIETQKVPKEQSKPEETVAEKSEELKFYEALKKVIRLTVEKAGRESNRIKTNTYYTAKLELNLELQLLTILGLDEVQLQREYMLSKLGYSEEGAKKHRKDMKNHPKGSKLHKRGLRFIAKRNALARKPLEKLFDEIATMERINHAKEYYSSLTGKELYEQYISKHFGGDLKEGLRGLKEDLKLKSMVTRSSANIRGYDEFIRERIAHYEKKNGVVINDEKVLGVIYKESLYQVFNVGPTDDYGLGMLTVPVIGGKDIYPKGKFQYSKLVNPFNPQENLDRTIEHIAYGYKKLSGVQSKSGSGLDELAITAFNKGAGAISRSVKNNGKEWKQYALTNDITRSYYQDVKDRSKKVKGILGNKT